MLKHISTQPQDNGLWCNSLQAYQVRLARLHRQTVAGILANFESDHSGIEAVISNRSTASEWNRSNFSGGALGLC